jgi:hypothetical protein
MFAESSRNNTTRENQRIISSLRRRCVWPTAQDCITSVYRQSANNMQQSLCAGTSQGEFGIGWQGSPSSNTSTCKEFCRKERVGKESIPSCCGPEFDPLGNLVLNRSNADGLLRDLYGTVSSQGPKFFKGVSPNAFDVSLHCGLGLFPISRY